MGCKFRKKLTSENRNVLRVAIALFVLRAIGVAKIFYGKEIQAGAIRFACRERYEGDGGRIVLP